MLQLLDKNRKQIKQWNGNKFHNKIQFIVQNSKLLSYYEDEKAITVFYGYLDQDYIETNPAECISTILSKKKINGLNLCFGSFIVIHYEKQYRHILFANDALGDFALHYTQGENKWVLSDFPSNLLTSQNNQINNDRLTHYFAFTPPQNTGCFYQKITQLNPGEYITIEDNEVTHNKYYTPPEKINYTANNIDDLAQKYKELIQTVIKCQTKGQKEIGVMMSGGMDSTFVTANALKAQKKVTTFSYIFPNMIEANEASWINAMQNKEIQMNVFSGESYYPLKSPWYVSKNSPVSNPYRHLKTKAYQQAYNNNIDTILTGVFADHLYTGYIYWLVDKIKKRPINAIKSLFVISKQRGLKIGLKQLAPAKWSKKIQLSAPWLSIQTQGHLKQKNKEQRLFKHPHPQQFSLTYGIATAQSAWMENEYSYKNDINIRHPYRDRRIVEFVMSIPAWVLGTRLNPKKFVQRASNGLLPNSIVRRNQMTTLKPLFIKGVMDKKSEQVNDILRGSKCNWHEFVDSKIIMDMLNKPTSKFQDFHYMVLWQCISYELWQNSLKKH